ncbi:MULTISPECIES: metal-dependent transcriptional regulator [unclassified Kribbella]|uniref:metal-dependent transcriptional regulator n=1 Tax=unclassified Kribbella TaxID=2644121 RepID=UPI0033FCDFEF
MNGGGAMKRKDAMESRVVENYLKAVFNAREWSDEPVTVGALATRLGLSPSSVSELVRKLTVRGLLAHARYGAIELTPEGQRIALAMVRKHRLIETFLVDYLGYTWDEVHEEAEDLEHAVSDTFIDRLAVRLGEPDHDPHGDPIPRSDGSLPDDDQLRLDAVDPGVRARVARVSDSDPELLRQLDQLGITIGTDLRVNHHHDEYVDVDHNGTSVVLDRETAFAIRVVPKASPS